VRVRVPAGGEALDMIEFPVGERKLRVRIPPWARPGTELSVLKTLVHVFHFFMMHAY
jgi:hypothetical protein